MKRGSTWPQPCGFGGKLSCEAESGAALCFRRSSKIGLKYEADRIVHVTDDRALSDGLDYDRPGCSITSVR